MSKKWAVLLVFLAEAFIYLFLLVGLPILESAVFCPTCNAREIFAPPLILYFIPGLIGLLLIVVIWKQKREAKDG